MHIHVLSCMTVCKGKYVEEMCSTSGGKYVEEMCSTPVH